MAQHEITVQLEGSGSCEARIGKVASIHNDTTFKAGKLVARYRASDSTVSNDKVVSMKDLSSYQRDLVQEDEDKQPLIIEGSQNDVYNALRVGSQGWLSSTENINLEDKPFTHIAVFKVGSREPVPLMRIGSTDKAFNDHVHRVLIDFGRSNDNYKVDVASHGEPIEPSSYARTDWIPHNIGSEEFVIMASTVASEKAEKSEFWINKKKTSKNNLVASNMLLDFDGPLSVGLFQKEEGRGQADLLEFMIFEGALDEPALETVFSELDAAYDLTTKYLRSVLEAMGSFEPSLSARFSLSSDLKAEGSVATIILGQRTSLASILLESEGTMIPSVLRIKGLGSYLEGEGTLEPSLDRQRGLSGALEGEGLIEPSVHLKNSLEALLEGQGKVDLSHVAEGKGIKASLQGTGSLGFEFYFNEHFLENVLLEGEGTLTNILGAILSLGIVSLQGEGSLEPDLQGIFGISSSLEGDGTLLSDVEAQRGLTSTLEGDGTFAPIMKQLSGISSSLEGEGTLEPQVQGIFGLSPSLEGEGTLEPQVQGIFGLSPDLEGEGMVTPILDRQLGLRMGMEGEGFLDPVSELRSPLSYFVTYRGISMSSESQIRTYDSNGNVLGEWIIEEVGFSGAVPFSDDRVAIMDYSAGKIHIRTKEDLSFIQTKDINIDLEDTTEPTLLEDKDYNLIVVEGQSSTSTSSRRILLHKYNTNLSKLWTSSIELGSDNLNELWDVSVSHGDGSIWGVSYDTNYPLTTRFDSNGNQLFQTEGRYSEVYALDTGDAVVGSGNTVRRLSKVDGSIMWSSTVSNRRAGMTSDVDGTIYIMVLTGTSNDYTYTVRKYDPSDGTEIVDTAGYPLVIATGTTSKSFSGLNIDGRYNLYFNFGSYILIYDKEGNQISSTSFPEGSLDGMNVDRPQQVPVFEFLQHGFQPSLEGSGSLEPTLSQRSGFQPQLQGTGSLDPQVSGSLSLSPNLEGQGSLGSKLGRISDFDALIIEGTGSLDPQISEIKGISSSLEGIGSLDPTLQNKNALQPELEGSGSLDPQVSGSFSLAAELEGQGSLDPKLGRISDFVALIMEGQGSLDPSISEIKGLNPSLEGQGTLDSSLASLRGLQTALEGEGQVSPNLAKKNVLQPSLEGTGTVTLGGAGIDVVTPVVGPAGDAVFTTDSDLDVN